ncbi:hypothetical protein LAZ67_2003980 [Cordylochernes scorpioides]|uniref:Uncharacterized protein n=1 Tax=Cordylochernes scorpioides TaxID=51811 RepID=A0ABY6K531_9ARAC|nr:hypothetical protein LAZ67_2003980 [Cordylochernes scorpioides]
MIFEPKIDVRWQGTLGCGSRRCLAGVVETLGKQGNSARVQKALGAAVGTFGGALVSNGWAGSAFMAVFTAVEALRSSGALGRVVAEATTAEADAGADGLLEVEDYSIHHDPPANAQGSKGLEVHLDEGGAGPVSGCKTVRHAHHLVPRKFSNSSGFQEGLLNCGVGCLLIHFEEADPWQDLLLLADLHSIQLAGQGGCNLRDGVRIAGMEDQLPLGAQGGPNALGESVSSADCFQHLPWVSLRVGSFRLLPFGWSRSRQGGGRLLGRESSRSRSGGLDWVSLGAGFIAGRSRAGLSAAASSLGLVGLLNFVQLCEGLEGVSEVLYIGSEGLDHFSPRGDVAYQVLMQGFQGRMVNGAQDAAVAVESKIITYETCVYQYDQETKHQSSQLIERGELKLKKATFAKSKVKTLLATFSILMVLFTMNLFLLDVQLIKQFNLEIMKL